MTDGEPTAADLFARHHVPVYRFLRRRTGSETEADDLAQETFLRVARGLPTYREHGTERAWIFRIARNVLANHWRDRDRHPENDDARRAADGVEPPEFAVPSRADVRLHLDEALAALHEADREAFLLREIGGLSYDEIAGVCDLTPDAVRNRIHRARRALRQALAPAPARGALHELQP